MRYNILLMVIAMGSSTPIAAADARPLPSAPPAAKPAPAPAPALTSTPRSMTTAVPAAPAAPATPAARALPAPYGTGPTASPVATVQASPASERSENHDAHATSNFLAPTAIMPPAGSFALHDYELLVIGVSYSPTSTFSLSATTSPWINDSDFVGLFSAKLQVYRGAGVRVALHGATLYENAGDASYNTVVGGVATLCFDDECGSHFTGYAATGISQADSAGLPFLLSAGLVTRLSENFKLLLELDPIGMVGGDSDIDDGILAWYGLRITSPHLALDLGFVRDIATSAEDSDYLGPFGFPVLHFSVRR